MGCLRIRDAKWGAFRIMNLKRVPQDHELKMGCLWIKNYKMGCLGSTKVKMGSHKIIFFVLGSHKIMVGKQGVTGSRVKKRA